MQDRFVRFTKLISSINRSIYRMKSEFMAEHNLRSSHVSCLYYVHRGMASSVSELCEVCDEDKANVSRSVKELIELGYMKRTRGSRGRRQARLETTEIGSEIGEFLIEQIDNIITIVGESLEPTERYIMYGALEKLEASLESLSQDIDVIDSVDVS